MKNKLRIIFKHSSIIVSLVLAVFVSIMSIGYAYYSSELSTIGSVNVEVPSGGDVIATSLTNDKNKNTTYINSDYTNQEHKEKSIITSNVYGTFNNGSGNYMTMIINIKNTSSVEQTFVDFSNSSTFNSDGSFLPQPRMLNLVIGDVLKPNESRDVKVIYYYKDTIDAQGSFEANFRFVFEDGKKDINVPNMMGVIDDNSFLVESEYVTSNINIANNFDVSVKYYLRVDNTDGSVGLVDASYQESSYSSILNAGESETRPIYFKVNLGDKESVTTKLYIETENKETYDIQELTFKKPGSTPQVESVIPISIVVNSASKWQGSYYQLMLEADNTANDIPLKDFAIVVKFKDGAAIRRIQYYGSGVCDWNPETFTYTINGLDQWNTNRPHVEIPASEKKQFGTFNLEFSDELETIDDYIEYVIVTHDIKDPGESEASCAYDDNNEFVCAPTPW